MGRARRVGGGDRRGLLHAPRPPPLATAPLASTKRGTGGTGEAPGRGAPRHVGLAVRTFDPGETAGGQTVGNAGLNSIRGKPLRGPCRSPATPRPDGPAARRPVL